MSAHAFKKYKSKIVESQNEDTERARNYFASGLADIISRNYSKAISDFVNSANAGNADAAFNLGLMYYYGQGTQVSYKECSKWTLRAASEGNVRAEYNISVLLENGDGAPENSNQSEAWEDKSANEGYNDRDQLSNMYDAGDDNLSDSNYKSAIAWTEKAAADGDPVSAYALAINYDHPDTVAGTDFPHDPVLAFKYYEIAAEGGMDDAQAHLASAYQNGVGVSADPPLAYEWYSIQGQNTDDPNNQPDTEDITSLAKEMSEDQLAQANEVIKNFKPK